MLTDKLLEEVTIAITPLVTHFGITETTITPNPTDTILSGEIGTRVSMTSNVVGNEVTFSGIRSSASVLDPTNGDDWKGIGFFNASTGGDLFSILSTTGILQSTNFDVEVQLKITPTRN
jgi:hypothetical protein